MPDNPYGMKYHNEDYIQEFTGFAPHRPYDASKTDKHLGKYVDYTKTDPYNKDKL